MHLQHPPVYLSVKRAREICFCISKYLLSFVYVSASLPSNLKIIRVECRIENEDLSMDALLLSQNISFGVNGSTSAVPDNVTFDPPGVVGPM